MLSPQLPRACALVFQSLLLTSAVFDIRRQKSGHLLPIALTITRGIMLHEGGREKLISFCYGFLGSRACSGMNIKFIYNKLQDPSDQSVHLVDTGGVYVIPSIRHEWLLDVHGEYAAFSGGLLASGEGMNQDIVV
ncbi:hypothetical protein FB451DRAFT_1183369 [Mycena latifolia]|nr:hypothetical protein FB451DRAFT_1183369 [Mycena latifolia]